MTYGDCKDFKRFGKQDGVDLRTYFEAIFKELRANFDNQVMDLEKKLMDIITSNDKLYMTKFADSKEAVNNAFTASQTAITKSEVSAEKRNDAVYVSLAELQKSLSSVVGRAEHDLSLKAVSDRLDLSVKTLNEKIETLIINATNTQGRGQGLDLGWKLLLGVVGLISTLTLLFNAIRLFGK